MLYNSPHLEIHPPNRTVDMTLNLCLCHISRLFHLCIKTFQVWTFVQRSLFLFSISTSIFVTASRTNVTFFRCLGREELFRCGKKKDFRLIFSLRYNLSNFYTTPVKFHGVEFQGPIWAPTRLFPNIANFSFVLIVPVLYGAIFRFRKKHTTTTLGGDQL